MKKYYNVMETFVDDQILTLMDSLDCCKCEKCMADIAASALNNLPPKYVSSTEGRLYTKLDAIRQQYYAEIITEVMNAAERVKENPKH